MYRKLYPVIVENLSPNLTNFLKAIHNPPVPPPFEIVVENLSPNLTNFLKAIHN
jgi:hypothetical protein